MRAALKKRTENISEYILYMFQIEDIIRAYQFDDEALAKFVLAKYQLSDSELSDTTLWYQSLSKEMLATGVKDHGHIPELNKLIHSLQTLSDRLLRMPSQSVYSAVYFRALPAILQLREHSNHSDRGEVEMAFVGVYGYLSLRMSGKEVSGETLDAMKQISTFLAMLADRYHAVERGDLVLE